MFVRAGFRAVQAVPLHWGLHHLGSSTTSIKKEILEVSRQTIVVKKQLKQLLK